MTATVRVGLSGTERPGRAFPLRAMVLLVAFLALAGAAWAQLPASLTAYANKISASEGGYGVISKYGCVGRYQFCPGTLQQYTSETPQQFANDPAAQDAAFVKYEQNQNALAQKNGYFNSVGTQVCATDKFGQKCGTLTDSSILYACQFGCAASGKLAAYIKNGYQCINNGSKATATNDANGVCAGDYALRGSGLDVSAITNRQSQTGTPTTTTPVKSTTPATTPATTTPVPTTPASTTPASSTVGTGGLQTTASGTPASGSPSGSPGTLPAARPGISLDFFGYQSGDQNGTQDFTVGDPTTCWICNAAMYSLGVVEVVGSSGAPAMVSLMWPLLVTFACIGLVLTVSRAVLSGGDPFRPTLRFLARLAVLGAVFGGGYVHAVDSSGGSNGSILFDYVLSPPINVGAAIGSDLADIASSVLTVNIEPNNCSYVDAATAKVSLLKDASDSLMKLLCKIHVAAATGIDLGAQIAIHSGSKETQMDQATAVVVSLLGSGVMILSMLAMLNFAFAVLEVLLKIGILSAFFPIFAFAWLFESTRGMARVVFDSMLFSVVYLSMCGISSVVGVYVMMESFSFGLGQNGATVSSAGLLSQFDSVASSMNLDTGTGLSQVAVLVGFSLAGSLMAVRLLRASHDMAVDLTGFALGRSGEMSKIGSKLVSSAVGMGAAGAGVVAAVGGRAAGAAAGSMSGIGRAGLARAGARR